MMRRMIQRMTRWALPVLVGLGPVAAFAQHPAKSVRLILPYAAGGGADLLTRAVEQSLRRVMRRATVAGEVLG